MLAIGLMLIFSPGIVPILPDGFGFIEWRTGEDRLEVVEPEDEAEMISKRPA